MNCKPGDLAVVVSRSEKARFLDGRVVRCLAHVIHSRLIVPGADENWWLCEGSFADVAQRTTARSPREDAMTRMELPDAWLRPLRDPGDDAQDETLSWLPVPHKEIA